MWDVAVPVRHSLTEGTRWPTQALMATFEPAEEVFKNVLSKPGLCCLGMSGLLQRTRARSCICAAWACSVSQSSAGTGVGRAGHLVAQPCVVQARLRFRVRKRCSAPAP